MPPHRLYNPHSPLHASTPPRPSTPPRLHSPPRLHASTPLHTSTPLHASTPPQPPPTPAHTLHPLHTPPPCSHLPHLPHPTPAPSLHCPFSTFHHVLQHLFPSLPSCAPYSSRNPTPSPHFTPHHTQPGILHLFPAVHPTHFFKSTLPFLPFTSPYSNIPHSSSSPKSTLQPLHSTHPLQPLEIFINDGALLTLHGLQQYYVQLQENEKNRKLIDLLDALEFNQLVIFVSSVQRAVELNKLLNECNFPTSCLHSGMKQTDRIETYKRFKEFKTRIMVATNLIGRGIDIERVNVVINYDMSADADLYLHRVARAGRFATKGLAISFVVSDKDKQVLADVQARFVVKVVELPDEIDATYMGA